MVSEADALGALGPGDVILAAAVVETLRAAGGAGPRAAFHAEAAAILDHGLVVDYRFGDGPGNWHRGFFSWAVVAAIALESPQRMEGRYPRSSGTSPTTGPGTLRSI